MAGAAHRERRATADTPNHHDRRCDARIALGPAEGFGLAKAKLGCRIPDERRRRSAPVSRHSHAPAALLIRNAKPLGSCLARMHSEAQSNQAPRPPVPGMPMRRAKREAENEGQWRGSRSLPVQEGVPCLAISVPTSRAASPSLINTSRTPRPHPFRRSRGITACASAQSWGSAHGDASHPTSFKLHCSREPAGAQPDKRPLSWRPSRFLSEGNCDITTRLCFRPLSLSSALLPVVCTFYRSYPPICKHDAVRGSQSCGSLQASATAEILRLGGYTRTIELGGGLWVETLSPEWSLSPACAVPMTRLALPCTAFFGPLHELHIISVLYLLPANQEACSIPWIWRCWPVCQHSRNLGRWEIGYFLYRREYLPPFAHGQLGLTTMSRPSRLVLPSYGGLKTSVSVLGYAFILMVVHAGSCCQGMQTGKQHRLGRTACFARHRLPS